jgi:geranylgeranylglycerol-phosphate geranylgeranyltransferase
MRKARALWELLRLEHGVMLALGILVGAVIAVPAIPPLTTFVLVFLVALFLEASTFALNDYYDVEIDRRNKRMDRPLVRGDLSPRSAVLVAAVLFPLGLVAAFFVNLPCFIIALVTAMFALVYDVVLKRMKVVGNFFIGYVMAIPFVFGGVAVIPSGGGMDALKPSIVMVALIAFLAGTGREVMKDVQDYEGDRAMGVKSFPRYLGLYGARVMAVCFFLAAVGLSFLPFRLSIFGRFYWNYVYLVFIVITDLLLVGASVQLVRRREPDFARLRKVTLVALLLGLLGFLFGTFFGGVA